MPAMARPTPARSALWALCLVLAGGCNLERGGVPKPQGKAGAEPLASVRDDVPLPLGKMLGHFPTDVEALLGEPLTKGSRGESCVRFVPKRVFFACESTSQTYADKTGAFKQVTVTYEDGVSTAVVFDGVRGDGPFTADAALAAVGLTLPFPPTMSNPAPEVTRWSWFNGQARLRIEGKEYRVEASVVDGKRERSRVEVILNHPLSEMERSRVLPVGGKKPELTPAGVFAPTPGEGPAGAPAPAG